MRRSTTILYLLLVFASGAMVGGFANRLYMMKSVSASTSTSTSKTRDEQYMRDMTTRLHLTDPQVASLRKIMDETRVRFRETHKTVEEEHAQKVLAILNDNQKAEYAKMREEREKRRRERDAKRSN